MEEAGFHAAVAEDWFVSSNRLLHAAKVGDQLGVSHPDGEDVGAPLLLRQQLLLGHPPPSRASPPWRAGPLCPFQNLLHLGVEGTKVVADEGKDEGEDEGGEGEVDKDDDDR